MTTIEKYDKIGAGYNQTRQADPYILSRLIECLEPKAGQKYLDVGCGTGNYSIELMKQGFDLTGMDPSEEMLSKASGRYQTGHWIKGSAENTGLSGLSIHGILAMLTIHHWKDLNKAFRELNRVLKPEGRLVIFTSTAEQMKGYWLNEYFPKMLNDSILQMPKYDRIKTVLESASLRIESTEKYFIKDDLLDHFLYCGKHRPELYLERKVRNGISSFTDLANQVEVQQGLKKLSQDIESNHIQEIIANYENELGDYLFVIARKN